MRIFSAVSKTFAGPLMSQSFIATHHPQLSACSEYFLIKNGKLNNEPIIISRHTKPIQMVEESRLSACSDLLLGSIKMGLPPPFFDKPKDHGAPNHHLLLSKDSSHLLCACSEKNTVKSNLYHSLIPQRAIPIPMAQGLLELQQSLKLHTLGRQLCTNL